jgi:hypothetical protein
MHVPWPTDTAMHGETAEIVTRFALTEARSLTFLEFTLQQVCQKSLPGINCISSIHSTPRGSPRFQVNSGVVLVVDQQLLPSFSFNKRCGHLDLMLWMAH